MTRLWLAGSLSTGNCLPMGVDVSTALSACENDARYLLNKSVTIGAATSLLQDDMAGQQSWTVVANKASDRNNDMLVSNKSHWLRSCLHSMQHQSLLRIRKDSNDHISTRRNTSVPRDGKCICTHTAIHTMLDLNRTCASSWKKTMLVITAKKKLGCIMFFWCSKSGCERTHWR